MSSLQAAAGAIGWRAAQQAGVQIIYFARLLLLAQLLAPEAFGMLAIATVALTTVLSLTDLGMVPALVQRVDVDRDALDGAWTIGLCRVAAIAAALALAAPAIASAFNEPRATPIIQILALRPVIEAAGSIGVVRLTRELRFRVLAFIQVPAALLDVCVAVALARSFGVWALVAGALAGAVAAAGLSYAFAPHRPRLVFRFAAAAPLIRFGRWMLATSILGLAATSGVQLVVSRQLGTADLGLYFLAAKMAFLPADAASAIVAAVAFPLYASLQHDAAATRATVRSLLTAQAAILFPAYVLLVVLAPTLVEVLGPAWAGTAPLVQIIGLGALGGIYADTALPLLAGRGRPDRVMVVVGAQTVVLLVVMLPFVATFGRLGAAIAWLPAYAAAFLASAVFVRQAVGHSFVGAGRQLIVLTGVALSAGVAAALAQSLLSGGAALIGGAALGVVTVVTLLIAIGRRMDLGIAELLSVRVTPVASQLST